MSYCNRLKLSLLCINNTQTPKRCINMPVWMQTVAVDEWLSLRWLLQCHPARDGQRGRCWCVDPKTGVRMTGPPELRGELDCHQLISATLRDWGEAVGGPKTSLILLVLVRRTAWLHWTSSLSLNLPEADGTWACATTKKIPLGLALLFFCLCVKECDSSLLSTCSSLILLCKLQTDRL